MKKGLFTLLLLLVLPFPVIASFMDVPDNHPYKNAIMSLQQKGLVKGYSGGTYRPDQTISRAEFTKILLLAKFDQTKIDMCTATDLSDITPAAWYFPYICFAKENAIIKGYADKTFHPDQPITYAEAAKIVVNTLLSTISEAEGEEWWKPFTDALTEKQAVPTSIKSESQQLTRGEMAQMIFIIQGGVVATPTDQAATEEYDSYESKTNNVSFRYFNTSTVNKLEKATTVLEKGLQIIVAAETDATDITECIASRQCSEQDGKKFTHLDSFYVLTKTPGEADFPASILSKIKSNGKDPENCAVIVREDAPAGWTKVIVEPKAFTSFSKNESGDTIDAAGKKLSANQVNKLRDQEAVKQCGDYAGGFGRSFFLYNSEKSPRSYLYLPSYGDDPRLIDLSSIEFATIEKNTPVPETSDEANESE